MKSKASKSYWFAFYAVELEKNVFVVEKPIKE